jgi:16S rRNA processing protein RimM
MSAGSDGARWVPLAEIARPHGVRGEVRLKVFNRDSDLLLELGEVLVRLPDGGEHEVSIDKARRAHDAILMKLHSVDDRDRAAELRGALVCARRSAFPALADGEFYVCDVVGARVVVEGADGHVCIGTVEELRSYPSVDVLLVKAADGGKPWEIPLVAAYVARVDPAACVVALRTVEGLER